MHQDYKGHTGSMVSMRSGLIVELLWGGKVNSSSLIEAKIVLEENALPQCLWLRYFIKGQGYAVEEIKFCQYNMSAMIMENNGKYSSTNKKKYM